MSACSNWRLQGSDQVKDGNPDLSEKHTRFSEWFCCIEGIRMKRAWTRKDLCFLLSGSDFWFLWVSWGIPKVFERQIRTWEAKNPCLLWKNDWNLHWMSVFTGRICIFARSICGVAEVYGELSLLDWQCLKWVAGQQIHGHCSTAANVCISSTDEEITFRRV